MTNILLAAVWLLMCKNGVQKVGTEVEKAMFATQLEANQRGQELIMRVCSKHETIKRREYASLCKMGICKEIGTQAPTQTIRVADMEFFLQDQLPLKPRYSGYLISCSWQYSVPVILHSCQKHSQCQKLALGTEILSDDHDKIELM